MEEVWKDIPRYGGKYQASNLGRVRNKKGYVLKLRKGWGGFMVDCDYLSRTLYIITPITQAVGIMQNISMVDDRKLETIRL